MNGATTKTDEGGAALRALASSGVDRGDVVADRALADERILRKGEGRTMRVLLAVGVSGLLWLPVVAADWTVVVDKLEKSVIQISDTCSAFVIDDERDYALTAKHCTPDDLTKPTTVDLIPSRVIADDVQYDLSVLHVPGLDRPALKLAKDEPHAGAEVGSWGFGYGFKKPMFRQAFVSQRRVSVPTLDGEWMVYDGAFVPGQSGCPVINPAGELIGIVQMTTDRMGIGRGADILADRVGKYFTKPKA